MFHSMITSLALAVLVSAVGAAPALKTRDCAAEYDQCGGSGWTGATCCQAGLTCQVQNSYYSQCLTGSGGGSNPGGGGSNPGGGGSNPGSGSGKVQFAGINISGFEFGQYDNCGTQSGAPYPPLSPGPDGVGQMNHFVSDDKLNAFRLPVTWQYLVNNDFTDNQLDASNFATYNELVQGCLNAGADLCIIDLHNYGRVNGSIIGQGGPSAAQFASLWGQIATKYAGESKIAFELMNEPNDVCNGDMDINTWQATMQGAVTAIRNAGASSQYIILAGLEFTHSITYLDSSGSGAAVLGIQNPSGSTSGLIIAVHEYLDQNDAGDGSACVTNNIDTSYNRGGLANFAAWLRQNNRQALMTETGIPPTDTNCISLLQQELQYLNTNSDVFLGWTGWAAGSFATSYTLSETPTNQGGGTWTDQPSVTSAIAGCFNNGSC